MDRWPPSPKPKPPPPGSFQDRLNEAFEKEPVLWDWIALSQAHRQDEVDKMILECLTEDAKKWPDNPKHLPAPGKSATSSASAVGARGRGRGTS